MLFNTDRVNGDLCKTKSCLSDDLAKYNKQKMPYECIFTNILIFFSLEYLNDDGFVMILNEIE